jgi:hypothetical protein
MADAQTTLYGFTLPEVGASEDTWGTKLNADFTSLDALLNHRQRVLVEHGGSSSAPTVSHNVVTARFGFYVINDAGGGTVNITGAASLGINRAVETLLILQASGGVNRSFTIGVEGQGWDEHIIQVRGDTGQLGYQDTVDQAFSITAGRYMLVRIQAFRDSSGDKRVIVNVHAH